MTPIEKIEIPSPWIFTRLLRCMMHINGTLNDVWSICVKHRNFVLPICASIWLITIIITKNITVNAISTEQKLPELVIETTNNKIYCLLPLLLIYVKKIIK